MFVGWELVGEIMEDRRRRIRKMMQKNGDFFLVEEVIRRGSLKKMKIGTFGGKVLLLLLCVCVYIKKKERVRWEGNNCVIYLIHFYFKQ